MLAELLITVVGDVVTAALAALALEALRRAVRALARPEAAAAVN